MSNLEHTVTSNMDKQISTLQQFSEQLEKAIENKEKIRTKDFNRMKIQSLLPKTIKALSLSGAFVFLLGALIIRYNIDVKIGQKRYFENMDDLINKIKIEQTKEQHFLKSIINDRSEGKDLSETLETYETYDIQSSLQDLRKQINASSKLTNDRLLIQQIFHYYAPVLDESKTHLLGADESDIYYAQTFLSYIRIKYIEIRDFLNKISMFYNEKTNLLSMFLNEQINLLLIFCNGKEKMNPEQNKNDEIVEDIDWTNNKIDKIDIELDIEYLKTLKNEEEKDMFLASLDKTIIKKSEDIFAQELEDFCCLKAKELLDGKITGKSIDWNDEEEKFFYTKVKNKKS